MPLLALFAAVALVALVASKGNSAKSEASMPPQIATAIDRSIAEGNPANMIAFANALEPFYPQHAAALRAHASK